MNNDDIAQACEVALKDSSSVDKQLRHAVSELGEVMDAYSSSVGESSKKVSETPTEEAVDLMLAAIGVVASLNRDLTPVQLRLLINSIAVRKIAKWQNNISSTL